jgi:hypothetical protein
MHIYLFKEKEIKKNEKQSVETPLGSISQSSIKIASYSILNNNNNISSIATIFNNNTTIINHQTTTTPINHHKHYIQPLHQP